MSVAMVSPSVSRAKRPASSRWYSSVFRSRLYGSAPAAGKMIVLAPGNQHRRLVLAEILLPLGLERWVAAVAEEQVELDLVVSLAVE
jgi:hypothetical protein